MSLKSYRRSLISGGLILAIALAVPMAVAHADENAATQQPVAVPVSVAAVEARPVTQWSEFSGRLEAVGRVELRSRVAGVIQSVHFQEGALVQQGDLLLTVDPAPYQAEVARAQANVSAATARYSLANTELVRGRQLIATKAVSQSDFDQRTNAEASAKAELEAARAVLDTAQLNLDYTQIRAPISGRVGKIEITPGNLIASGPSSPILTSLVTVDPIYASFEADEELVSTVLASLPEGLNARRFIDRVPVRMDVAGQSGVSGQLQLIDNSVDPLSGTVRVRAVFDNHEGVLMPGQFARLRMGQATEQNVLLVDERAIGTDQNKRYVMVVKPDNTTEYREISLGAKSDGLRVVLSGLQAKERIVVNGLQRIRPGMLVAPEMVSMAGTKKEQLEASIAKPAN
jgi:multidrug efflux system membrane fusion protein